MRKVDERRIHFKVLRRTVGWTQDEAAFQLGTTANTISRYERGTRQIPEPLIRLLERIVKEWCAQKEISFQVVEIRESLEKTP